MTRYRRTTHAFADEADFNAQLYTALRRSPWWMTSLGAHVLVFLVLTLLDTSAEAAPVKKTVFRASVDAEVPPDHPVDPPKSDIEREIEFTPNEFEQLVQTENEDPIVDTSENDLDYEGALGDDGSSEAWQDGPMTNGTTGIGGNAGSPFGTRTGGGDRPGGTGGPRPGSFDGAVEDALRWLAAHQSPNGGWEAAGFMSWCDGRPVADAARRPDGAGKALYDPGVTGLALCAFLGAGYTNRGKHPFAKVVSRGLRYLKNIQDPEGCFGPRASQQYIYNHATAALAMVEAYGMTGSAIFKGSAQRALDFLALARNPYFAWRYGIKPGDNDTSVSGWMMMALKSAQLVNKDAVKRGRAPPLVIDESAFNGLEAWLDKVTDPDCGRVGYVQRGSGPARPPELVDRFPAERSESMTAVGVLARVFMGEDPRKSRLVKLGVELCAQRLPAWNPSDGSIDMYYWYYGTLAMYQAGGKAWNAWRKKMVPAMVDTQRDDTDYCRFKGSWDPIGPWGGDGGRVYATAVMAMCLQVYYRYDLVFGAK